MLFWFKSVILVFVFFVIFLFFSRTILNYLRIFIILFSLLISCQLYISYYSFCGYPVIYNMHF